MYGWVGTFYSGGRRDLWHPAKVIEDEEREECGMWVRDGRRERQRRAGEEESIGEDRKEEDGWVKEWWRKGIGWVE